MRSARLAVTLIFCVIAACGGGGGDTSKTDALLSNAVEKTVAAGSARLSATVKGGGLPTSSIDGVYDFKGGKGAFSFALDGGGMSGRAQIISVGSAAYMNLGQELVAGKSWIKIDAASLPGGGFAPASEALRANPATALQFLGGAEAVERVGRAVVREVTTTHYKLRVDLQKAARSQPAEIRQQLERLGKLEFPADAWVDDQSRLRRISYRIDLSKMGGPTTTGNAKASSVVVTQDLYDFGAAVDAEVPPADQVADMSELDLGDAGAGAAP